MLRKEAEKRRTQWARALYQIASETGKASPLTYILGTVAWGRYDGEPGAADSKDNALIGYGFLMGVRYASLLAAERFKLDGVSKLRNIHDRIEKEAQKDANEKLTMLKGETRDA